VKDILTIVSSRCLISKVLGGVACAGGGAVAITSEFFSRVRP